MLGLVAVLGLVIGSFLNVVVWRVPRGESVIQPPSACPTCHHPIRRRDVVPDLSWAALLRACIGGAVLWLLYFLMVVVYPAGMGFGDVKLAGVLGAALAWLGWGSLVIGAFTAFLLGGIFAIGLVLAGHATRKTGIPFGPWMLLGCAVGVAFGEPVWNAYLTLLV